MATGLSAIVAGILTQLGAWGPVSPLGWALLAAIGWQIGWGLAALLGQRQLRRSLDRWDMLCWGTAALVSSWSVVEVFGVSPFDPWIGRFGVLVIGIAVGVPYFIRMQRLLKRDLAEIEALMAVADRKETTP